VTRLQAQAESKATSQDDELRRLKAQVEELSRQVQELNGLKARLTHENFELHRQVQELDSNNAALAKARAQLQQQLDDAKAKLDEESMVGTLLYYRLEWDSVCSSFDLPAVNSILFVFVYSIS